MADLRVLDVTMKSPHHRHAHPHINLHIGTETQLSDHNVTIT